MDANEKKVARAEVQALLKELREKYRYTPPEIDSDEPEYMRHLKWVVTYRLSVVDRTILLLYAETRSLRKLGALLNCSHSTIRPEVCRIQRQVKEELNKIKNVENI